MIFLFRLLFVPCILWLLLLNTGEAVSSEKELASLITRGGYMVTTTAPPLQKNENVPFIPASTLKILTCLVALEQLGEDFRFRTAFYLDHQNNLYIKGFGDPFLTSEVIPLIGEQLKQRNIVRLNTLYLDQSSYALLGERASETNSDNPYDAPNGALAVNFNSVPIVIDQQKKISSGEKQTPLLPLMIEAGAHLPPGRHRINIDTLPGQGSIPSTMRYVGELFIAQLKASGISITGGFAEGRVPRGLAPVYTHISEKSLTELVSSCLKYSNNFITNQLFLATGMSAYGPPASWEKSRRFITNFLRRNLKIPTNNIVIKDGAGLSRKNRISAAELIAVLDRFKPYAKLLKKRGRILLKSGTLKGVYCYAGYFPQGKKLAPFVLLLNQPKNTRDATLQALYQLYKIHNQTTVH